MQTIVRVWGLRMAALAALCGVWLFASGPGGVSDVLIPSLTSVLGAFAGMVAGAEIWSAAARTLLEMAAGFIIALVGGLIAGVWGGRKRFRASVVEPLLAWGYLVPTVLFYPLFLLWFGLGPWSKILYAALAAFFPIAFNTVRGLQGVDPKFVRLGRAFGGSSTQVDVHIKLGAALPMVLSGVRIGVALTTIAVILAEMVASTAGVGYELSEAFQTLKTARGYAIIIFIILMVALVQQIADRGLSKFRT